MYLISSSFGNDSIALIQWVKEQGLEDVYVLYCDTGWSHPEWPARVRKGFLLAESYGFTTWAVKGEFDFEGIVKMKGGFPNNLFQWCSGLLKGIPLNEFDAFLDPNCEATVVIGKRREESEARKDTPEYIENSDYHEGRTVWHPLYLHTERQRNALIKRAGWKVLKHRSMECCPCVNANRNDLRHTPDNQIDRVRELEMVVGRNMYKPSRHGGAEGIDQVMDWALSTPRRYKKGQMMLWTRSELCGSGLCGY